MQKWLYSDKAVVFGQSGNIRANLVVFGQKWLFFGQSDCNWAKVFVLGQSGCIRAKKVLLGQKWLYAGKSGCIRAKEAVFVENLVFG